jgi:hypothetical protein
MRQLSEIGLFFPEWLTPWLGVAAIAAAIMGWGRLAASLGAFVAINIFVMPLLEGWLGQLPIWASALAVILLSLLVIHALIALVFGKEAAGQFTGTWLVRISDALILGPFRIVQSLWRLLM